jgi:hypothetical protein
LIWVVDAAGRGGIGAQAGPWCCASRLGRNGLFPRVTRVAVFTGSAARQRRHVRLRIGAAVVTLSSETWMCHVGGRSRRVAPRPRFLGVLADSPAV